MTDSSTAHKQDTHTRSVKSSSSKKSTSAFSEDHSQDLFDGHVHGERCDFFLGLTEDDGPTVAAAVHLYDITDDQRSLRPVTGDCQVLHARKTHVRTSHLHF